ncbi:MAG: SGNH/GDSL hydrolase family protein [Bacteroidales bacterium]|nr:SGNH/GDSL hydrolase family protein [Lachnoclostridium sp.]MCM1383447.1 SGNH/GDSL hydrolase family protein [Lachnoclostridium sp.]MCM1464296.1 SGNH/GDSL hydrolase family protein [Bacteroidales bacterium]
MENNHNEAKQDNQKKYDLHRTMHIVLLVAVVVSIGLLVWKFSNWGTFVDIHDVADNPDDKYEIGMDEILPLFTGTEDAINDDGVTNILVFGNHPFSDDRDSEDSLANIIAREADATVYNCAVSNSCMSSQLYAFSASEYPMDAYSFYWLVTLAVTGANKTYYTKAAAALGENTPPEAQEVYDTLTTLDLNTIDVAVIMYDATDYFLWRNPCNPDNATDITTFAGNLEAGIEMLQEHYPNIRIIVMSPTYAYVDVDGEYVSSDLYVVNGEHTLPSYLGEESNSTLMRSVTLVDNLYGSVHEENAHLYLRDNLHLNVEGRKVVADHFIYALNYFNKEK